MLPCVCAIMLMKSKCDENMCNKVAHKPQTHLINKKLNFPGTLRLNWKNLARRRKSGDLLQGYLGTVCDDLWDE